MKRAIQSLTDKRIFFVFSIIAIVSFLVIGMPLPPGFIYQASENYLTSQPGYSYAMSGSLTQAQVESNVDIINSYFVKAIFILILNVLLYFFLYVLGTVLIWNYLVHKNISLKGFWKSSLFNIFWLLFAVFIGIVLFMIFGFLGTLGPNWWLICTHVLFGISISLLFVFTMIFNCHLQKSGQIFNSVSIGFKSFVANWSKIILAIICLFFVIAIASLVYNIESVTFSLTEAVVAIITLFGIACLNLYIAALLDVKTQKVTQKKN